MSGFFKVFYKSKKSGARIGEIKTDHGVIKTPAFMPAATKGTIKSLPPQFIEDIGIQVSFVNTYHLVTHPGVDIIEKAGGIHKYTGLNIPLMSDSGGFQVFSLARSQREKLSLRGTIVTKQSLPAGRQGQKEITSSSTSSPPRDDKKVADIRGEEQPLLVKISEDGVKFRSTFDGKIIEFTPEKSMEYQKKIGADINIAFDECTYYPASHEYAEKAMKRTHEWLLRCIKCKESSIPKFFDGKQQTAKNLVSSLPSRQYLYGVIQGATFKDLRKKSAEFVVSQDTPGVAIGGVSVGESKEKMREQVKWINNYLPKDRPVHLLGVGQIDDIINLVKFGIDTFDCVEPTRLARMGQIYKAKISIFSTVSPQRPACRQAGVPRRLSQKQKSSLSGQTDITKNIYKNNLEPVDKDCNCYICKNFTKSYLHHLFKQREILGYTLATYHNLYVMERLFDRIREAIGNNLL